MIQGDGKILGVGTGLDVSGMHANVDVARWNADGTLDAGFGTAGIVETDLGTNGSTGYAIALQANQRPVVVATQIDAGANMPGEQVVIRYTATGVLDRTFASGGIFHLPASVPTTSRGYGNAIALQPDGMILAGGNTLANDPIVFRVTPAGLLDTSFGNEAVPLGKGGGGVQSIALGPDGRILCINPIALIQLLVDGSPDKTFGPGGARWRTGGVTISDRPWALVRLPTGRSRVTTSTYETEFGGGPPGIYFYTFPFTAGGTADASFGDQNDQFVQSPSGTPTMTIYAMALQPDGRFLAAGVDAKQFVIARFNGNALVLRPRAFSFPSVTGVPTSTLQTSQPIRVESLTADAYVPIYVTGGSYSINGAPFTTALDYAINGDTIIVQHTSAATSGTSVTTTLSIGGLNTPTAPWVVTGKQGIGTFTSTTQ